MNEGETIPRWTGPKRQNRSRRLTAKFLTQAQKLRIQVEYYECKICKFRDNDLRDFLNHLNEHRKADASPPQISSLLPDIDTELGDSSIVDDLVTSISPDEPLSPLDGDEQDILPACHDDEAPLSTKSRKRKLSGERDPSLSRRLDKPHPASRKLKRVKVEPEPEIIEISPEVVKLSNSSTIVKKKRGRPKKIRVYESDSEAAGVRKRHNSVKYLRTPQHQGATSEDWKVEVDSETERLVSARSLVIILERCDGLIRELKKSNLFAGVSNGDTCELRYSSGFKSGRKRKRESRDSDDSVALSSKRLKQRFNRRQSSDSFCSVDDSASDEEFIPLKRGGRKRRKKFFGDQYLTEIPQAYLNRRVTESKPDISTSHDSNIFPKCSVVLSGLQCRFCGFKTTLPMLLDRHIFEGHKSENNADSDDNESQVVADDTCLDDSDDNDPEPVSDDMCEEKNCEEVGDSENYLRSKEYLGAEEKCKVTPPIVVPLQKPILQHWNA